MNNVLWFSRHAPSEAQLAEIAAAGETIAGLAEGETLGSIPLKNEEDVTRVIAELFALAEQHNARKIYGVFATPIQSSIFRSRATRGGQKIECFAAWNILRAETGGKGTFEHMKFAGVGTLKR